MRLWFIAVLLLFAGCAQLQKKNEETKSWMQEEHRIRVLCTSEHVAAIAREVGGDDVLVLTLIPGQSDPHSYQVVKGDDAKFRRAHLILYSGLTLEQGAALGRYLHQYSAHALGDYIQAKTNQAIYTGSVIDPHIWNDLHLWAYGAFLVADELSKIRPQRASYFHQKSMELFNRYQAQSDEFRKKMQTIDEKRRYLVTTHDAFNYFCRAYIAFDSERETEGWRSRYMSPEGFSPESQISTKDIQKVIDYIIAHNVHSVFSEVCVNQDSLKKVIDICNEEGGNVSLNPECLYSDTLGPNVCYEEAMRHNVDVIAHSFMKR